MTRLPLSSIVFRFGVFGLVFVAVLLRVIYVSSDPYPHLDWSSGLLTDESFYAHNARNLVLFGRARMDEFNNMLLSPLVHLAQWGTFSLFGVGFVASRLLAVFVSIISVTLLFGSLNRAFGIRVAGLGTLFFGLDHTYLLYSRMSLLDTFAVLPTVAAFYCFVRALEKAGAQRSTWLAACGVALAAGITNRSLCIYLLPVPFIALWCLRTRLKDSAFVYSGLLLAGLIHLGAWYMPNRAEIAHMTEYYRTVQLQPKSPKHLLFILYYNLLGDRRGISPYHFRHTPVVFSLVLIGLALKFTRGVDSSEASDDNARVCLRYLGAWLILGWSMLFVLGYSPTRYYVTTYPALCALAAVAVTRIPHFYASLRAGANRVPIAAVAWFLSYHLVESIVHRRGVVDRILTQVLLFGVPTVAAWLVMKWNAVGEDKRSPISFARWAVAIWGLVNTLWLSHWMGTLRWSQVEFAVWMTRNLPPGTVAVGDVAAGLSLGHPFQSVNVIPGLCNFRNPLEAYAGHPRYIIMLDGKWRERFWKEAYGHLVKPDSALHRTRVLKWDVGLYSANEVPMTRIGSGDR